MKLELEEIIKATSAKVLKNDIKTGKLNFSTDTRTIKKGDIFVPIKGETFDGENFIENALNNGAEVYFTCNEKVFDNAKTVLQVKDTLVAYLECARLYRKSAILDLYVPQTDGELSGSILQSWTPQAIECYELNQNCSKCSITKGNYSFICQLETKLI